MSETRTYYFHFIQQPTVFTQRFAEFTAVSCSWKCLCKCYLSWSHIFI